MRLATVDRGVTLRESRTVPRSRQKKKSSDFYRGQGRVNARSWYLEGAIILHSRVFLRFTENARGFLKVAHPT